MKSKKLASVLSAIGLGLALASPPASAVIQFFFPTTTFEDNDLDFVVDNNNNNVIDAGDRIISVLEFGATAGIFTGQGPTAIGPQELTGVIDITVTGPCPGNPGALCYAASGAAGVLSGFAANTVAALWTDATPDLDVINANCGTRANCLALAGLGGTDGSTLFLTAGLFGDVNNYLFSTGTVPTITGIQGAGPTTIVGSLNFGLDVGINNTGQVLGNISCVPFCGPGGDGFVRINGSGSLLGGSGLPSFTQWTARSDNDASVNPIPEPASLALVGLALAGLGVMRRRNKTAG
jgi:hypothetical protein